MKKYGLIFTLLLSVMVNVVFIAHDRVKLYDWYLKKVNTKKEAVFFGDSRIAEGDWAWVFKKTNIQKSGLSGFTTKLLFDSLKPSVIAYHPKICFVEAGINDIFCNVKYNVPLTVTYANYKKIIDTLLQNNITPVILGIFYVNQKDDEGTNVRVDSVNNFLEAYCRSKQIAFMDLNPMLSQNRRLLPQYTFDGIHLNEKGYTIWYAKVKPLLP